MNRRTLTILAEWALTCTEKRKRGLYHGESSSPRFTFDRISISEGKSISFSISGVIRKKDTLARTENQRGYYQRLQWIGEIRRILRRKGRLAWLVDGLDALLRLVRESLERSKILDYQFLFQVEDFNETVPGGRLPHELF